MAVGNVYVFAFLTALVAVNLIFAEENSLQQGSQIFEQAEIGSDNERDARSANEEEEPQERTFFTLIPIPTRCNSTAQRGSTCRSCTQALYCGGNNVGFVRNCRGFLRFCNNGQCSWTPGANCASG